MVATEGSISWVRYDGTRGVAASLPLLLLLQSRASNTRKGTLSLIDRERAFLVTACVRSEGPFFAFKGEVCWCLTLLLSVG